MDIRELSPELFVSSQISIADVAVLKQQGFRAIICNRPDDEEYAQPTFAEISDAAQAIGLQVAFIPVVPGAPMIDEPAAFKRALDDMDGPVLAYCRSGARCTMLWMATK